MKMFLKLVFAMGLSAGAAQSLALPIQTVTGYGDTRGTNTLAAQKETDRNALQQCGAQLAQRVTVYTCYGFLGQVSCNADYRCVNDLHQPLSFDPDKTVEGLGYAKTGNFEDARAALIHHTHETCGRRRVLQVTELKCRSIGVIETYAECRFYYACK